MIEKAFAMARQNIILCFGLYSIPKAICRQIMNPDNNEKYNTEGYTLHVFNMGSMAIGTFTKWH